MKEGSGDSERFSQQKVKPEERLGSFIHIYQYFMKNIRHLILGFSSERDRKTVSKWFKAEKGTLLFHNTNKSREHLASDTAKFRIKQCFAPPLLLL